LSEGKVVNIHTDSRYGYGVTYDFGAIWRERGFINSSGGAIKNGKMIDNLLSAILLPRKLAIVTKCEAHTNNTDDVSRGNARADLAAKAAAKSSDVSQVSICLCLSNRKHALPLFMLWRTFKPLLITLRGMVGYLLAV